MPGARHSRHQAAPRCPGSRGRASLGADAGSPTDASPHPAPSRLHLSVGQGRQTARKSRSSAPWVQHLWGIFNGSGSRWLGKTRPDPSRSPSPVHRKEHPFGFSQTSCWKGGLTEARFIPQTPPREAAVLGVQSATPEELAHVFSDYPPGIHARPGAGWR